MDNIMISQQDIDELKDKLFELQNIIKELGYIKDDFHKLANGEFSYNSYDNVDFYQGYKNNFAECTKSIDFKKYYTINNDEINALLNECKKCQEDYNEIINDIDEVEEIANKNVEDYYETVLDVMSEIDKLVEMDSELYNNLAQVLSINFYKNKFFPEEISVDFVISVLRDITNNDVQSYLQRLDDKLKSLSLNQYEEVGLEIFKKEITKEEKEENENAYINDLDTILKNAGRRDELD